MFGGVFAGQRVMVTGHTGFKGSWLAAWLLDLGAEVIGFANGVPTEPSHFQILSLRDQIRNVEGDVRDADALAAAFREFKPEIVFHLAAQPLVRQSYEAPAVTFATNVLGTVNVLENIRDSHSVQAAVIVTSDKCYENVEWTWGYRENDPLGGRDPYSASKACAELATAAYSASYFSEDGPRIATARAGNVVGGGDWAADRVIPDCVRAWSKRQPARLRNPQSTRPWQHVLEPLSGYLLLAAHLATGDEGICGNAFNFGPATRATESVKDLIEAMALTWDAAQWQQDEAGERNTHEANLLRLNCDRAQDLLGWHAVLNFPDCVRFTSDWYRAYYQEGDDVARRRTREQVKEFCLIAARLGLPWAS
jgi:CDP-glucose 4,6-dehydratase